MGLKRTDEFWQDAVRNALTSGLTRKQVAGDLGVGFEHINGFYNPRRRHSALGWKSPVAFERKVA